MKKQHLVGLVATLIGFTALGVGCGQSIPSGPLKHNIATQERAKLNAMPVKERLAYLKKHRDEIAIVAGGSPPHHLPPKPKKLTATPPEQPSVKTR